MFWHKPVMPAETLSCLAVAPGGVYIDCTAGEGGHSELILKKADVRLLVLIEQDREILSVARERLKDYKNILFINDNFVRLKEIADRLKLDRVDGILFDLGLSLFHYKKSGRGFSFEKNEKLDMRLSGGQTMSASDIVNRYSRNELARLIWAFGEERWTKPIVERIVEERRKKPVRTTEELKILIERTVPRKFWKKGIHPATQTFQALRIAVNNELFNLDLVLDDAIRILSPGGRLAVQSYHSLEDRIVKHKLNLYSRGLDEKGQEHPEKKGVVSVLTKKPLTAAFSEIRENPRARSAKLRACEKS